MVLLRVISPKIDLAIHYLCLKINDETDSRNFINSIAS